ncbi:MAG: hypothetical protein KC457_35195, partial [Myxococcales bacterium]|nr:hypothetical protein [Myxococcales bacterium]
TDSTTGEPLCARKRYTLNMANHTWTSIALDQAWTGANAPPCSQEILATSLITNWDELLVLTADEMLYRRIDGVWQTPVSWADSFGVLVGENPTGMIYMPSLDDPTQATLYFNLDDGRAALYEYSQGGGIVFADIYMLSDVPPPGAPQFSEIARWGFAWVDTSLAPDANWLVWYLNYSDGNLYTFDAAFTWTQAPEGNNDLFGTGQADEPTPALIEAAFADRGQNRAYFVGP